MKHCHKAGPVALSKPRSALWTHTPTSAPPDIPERNLPRSGECALRKRDGENERAKGKGSYWPLPLPPVNQSSTSWLLLWYDTARRWVKTATITFRENNKPDRLFTHATARAGFMQSGWKRKRDQFAFPQFTAEDTACLVNSLRSSLI